MASLGFFGSLRVPYPDYAHGFWGQQTSTLNFCEEDYALSFYCAEVINTATNALFLWLGIKGIRSCMYQGHDPIFLLAYVGYIIVGLGSISFHATLKYPMQLVDELSMIYTTCLMMYASFAYSRSKYFSASLGVGLLALAGSITLYYHITKDPAFHQGAYAALTATVVFRSMWVMESQLRPALESRGGSKSQALLKTMWIMVATGLIIFVGGYAVWNLDNMLCTEVRRLRRAIGLPWAVLLEGHGWWHLMTGIGGENSKPAGASVATTESSSTDRMAAYYYITWGIWLRHCLSGHEEEYTLHWPRLLTSIPEVVYVGGTPGDAADKPQQNSASKAKAKAQ